MTDMFLLGLNFIFPKFQNFVVMNFVAKNGAKLIVIWLLLGMGACNLGLCNDLRLWFKYDGLITRIKSLSQFLCENRGNSISYKSSLKKIPLNVESLVTFQVTFESGENIHYEHQLQHGLT